MSEPLRPDPDLDLETLRKAMGQTLCEISDRRMRAMIAKERLPADWSDAFVILTADEVEDVRSRHPEVIVPLPPGMYGYRGILLYKESLRLVAGRRAGPHPRRRGVRQEAAPLRS